MGKKKSQLAVVTPKTAARPFKGKRKLIRRGVESRPGAGNILVIRPGEFLRENVQERLNAMKADFESIEFHWTKIMTMPHYHETREYPKLVELSGKWQLKEGVKDLVEFRGKMKRLKVLVDHFQPGHDYELFVDEVVEILN